MRITASFNTKLKDQLLSNEYQKEYFFDDYCTMSEKALSFEDNNIKIILIGEIYNLSSLIEKPISNPAQGIGFLFKKLSFDAFKKLDGEFTIIIKTEQKWIIYRDRHGASSQIYFSNDYFVSHQKDLALFKGFSLEPDFQSLSLFLKIGYIPSPQTALKNVQKLPAGYVLIHENKKNKIIDLYSYKEFGTAEDKIKITEQEATEEYEHLHKKAIRERVKNKQKVQLLLSGGYDSGGNIDALRKVYQGEAFSYSIGFKNNPWSELPLAKLMSEVYNTQHFEYEIDGKEIEDLPKIIEYLGDPFNESGMMVNYAVLKLVREKSGEGIILGGDGNDQHFGSAGRELALHYKYKKNGIHQLQKLIQSFSDIHLFEKDNIFFKMRFHNEKVINILQSDAFGFRNKQINKILKTTHNSNLQYLKDIPKKINSFDELFNVHNYFGDIKQVINEVILFKASKLSENLNHQISFPYMSTDLYNFLKQLPRDVKLKGNISDCAKGIGESKFLHKNYLHSHLPKEITERKKQGGFAPLPIFFKDPKRFKMISQVILNASITKKHLNQSYIEQILDQYRTQQNQSVYWFWNQQVEAFKIFNLLVLVLWWEIVIENKTIQKLSDIL